MAPTAIDTSLSDDLPHSLRRRSTQSRLSPGAHRQSIGSPSSPTFLEGALPHVRQKVAHHDPNPEEWADHVRDLRCVLDVMKQLFITLQHSNEALIRVGLEIIMDEVSSDMMNWSYESIYQDDNHLWMTELVKRKLELALKMHPGAAGKAFSCQRVTTEESGTQTADVEESSEEKELRLEREREAREAQAAELQKEHLQEHLMETINAERRKLQQELRMKQTELEAAEERARAAEARVQDTQAARKDVLESSAKAVAEGNAAGASAAASEMQSFRSDATTTAGVQTGEAGVAGAHGKQSVQVDEHQASERKLREELRTRVEAHEALERRNQELQKELHELQAKHHKGAGHRKNSRSGISHADERRASRSAADDLAVKLSAAQHRIQELEAAAKKAETSAAAAASAAAASASVAKGRQSQTDASSSTTSRATQTEEVSNLKHMMEDLQDRMERVRTFCRDRGMPEDVVDVRGISSFIKALTVWERLYQDAHRRSEKLDLLREKWKDHGPAFPVEAQGSSALPFSTDLQDSQGWPTKATSGTRDPGSPTSPTASAAVGSTSAAAPYPNMVLSVAERLRQALRRRPAAGQEVEAEEAHMPLSLPATIPSQKIVLQHRPSVCSTSDSRRQSLVVGSASLPGLASDHLHGHRQPSASTGFSGLPLRRQSLHSNQSVEEDLPAHRPSYVRGGMERILSVSGQSCHSVDTEDSGGSDKKETETLPTAGTKTALATSQSLPQLTTKEGFRKVRRVSIGGGSRSGVAKPPS